MTVGHWETVQCPHCPSGGVHPVRFISCRDRFDGPGSYEYSLVRCSGCGLIYLSPRPSEDEASGFYQADGYDPFLTLSTPTSLQDKIYARARDWTLSWKRGLVRQLLPASGSVLDLGCSTGEFLAALKSDYAVEGIEPEEKAARFAREQFKMTVHHGTLDAAPLENQPYDLVTLWHVLEHIPDPVNALAKIHSLLKPDGTLLLALPNVGSADATLYRQYWVPLDAPRHLWNFTPSSLDFLMTKMGFRRFRFGMLPLDTFYNCLMSEQLIIKQSGKINLLLTPFRLPLAVIASLVKGAFTGQHSGIYYLYRLK